MKQITNVNDLQEGDVMELGGIDFRVSWLVPSTGRILVESAGSGMYSDGADSYGFDYKVVQDLMDHGIPFRRKVAEGGKSCV